MTTGTVGLDEVHDTGGLINSGIRNVLCPTHWLIRDFKVVKQLIPEGVVDKQLRHGAQELTRFGALNHAVVIGGSQGDQAAHTEFCQAVRGSACEFSRVVHRTNTDDSAQPLGQPGNGVTGTDATRVSQVDRCALEISRSQFVLAGTGNNVVVSFNKFCEVLILRLLQRGNDKRAGTIFLRQVDSQTQVDVFRVDYGWLLTVDQLVAHVHVWVLLRGLDQRIPNNVGERNLATTGAL